MRAQLASMNRKSKGVFSRLIYTAFGRGFCPDIEILRSLAELFSEALKDRKQEAMSYDVKRIIKDSEIDTSNLDILQVKKE